MAPWILILAVIGADGEVRQLAPVAASFASADACNAAGVLASASLPNVRHPREAVWHRVDWVCASTDGLTDRQRERRADMVRETCDALAAQRESAKTKLRDEMREALAP